jgi:hypothetical protein
MIQRREFIAAVIVAVALTADAGHAQESFFHERFCAQTNSVPSGIPDCSFYNLNQDQKQRARLLSIDMFRDLFRDLREAAIARRIERFERFGQAG